MKSIKQVLDEHVSNYTGSLVTREMVRAQIAKRWNKELAESFDPYNDAMTLVAWSRQGYRVKAGERALRSFTISEIKDELGKVTRRIRRPVFLFHFLQVRKVDY